jgi:3-isopropylmalate/(R)-2-methylmalate dehydratase small subunit
LNQPQFEGATILLAGNNFGCGSSREHAPWALLDYGFRSIIAPSFADIFYNNCFKNGMLPIRLPDAQVEKLFKECAARPGYTLTVSLEHQTVEDDRGTRFSFEIDAFKRECLLRGLDDIALTLEHERDIRDYEVRRRAFS